MTLLGPDSESVLLSLSSGEEDSSASQSGSFSSDPEDAFGGRRERERRRVALTVAERFESESSVVCVV